MGELSEIAYTTDMKILFVTTEFEEQARGITGIVKSMIRAAKADGHEVGILAGYPNEKFKHHDILDQKIEHINLQHYLISGKKEIFPKNLNSKKEQLKLLSKGKYLSFSEFRVDHALVTDQRNMANLLDYVIKIPFCYHFINHGLDAIPKRVLKRAIKKSGVDLVITGAPMSLSKLDVAPAKLAQFVHDTMPVDMLETPADNNTPFRFARQFYSAAAESDMVFVNSKDTENKVLEVNPSADTQVVYGTATATPKGSPKTAILKTLDIEEGNYLLYISVVEKRKNVIGLIDAFALIHNKLNMPLIIVGGKGYGNEDIQKHYDSLPANIRSKIFFTGFVSENDKYMLLNNARTFVFPSFYEGIGLPIIEALSSGIPVVTSDRGALPEAGGTSAFYIKDPYDVTEIADAIYNVSTNEKLRKSLLKNADKQTAKFTIEKFNKRFTEGLRRLTQ